MVVRAMAKEETTTGEARTVAPVTEASPDRAMVLVERAVVVDRVEGPAEASHHKPDRRWPRRP